MFSAEDWSLSFFGLSRTLGVRMIGQTGVKRVFVGRSGLRAGWGIAMFVSGSIGGMVFCSLLMRIMALGNALAFDGWALHGFAILEYGLFWALLYLIVGFFEETLFRGYIQHTLARSIGFWPAALSWSAAFGLAHLLNSGEDVAGIVVAILGGILLSLCLKLSGSLWWGIGFHTALGWAESFFYGTANSGNAVVVGHLLSTHPTGDPRFSGGAVGPEGSFICARGWPCFSSFSPPRRQG